MDISQELCLRDAMYAIQKTREWKDRYRIRAGIEATISELKRAHGMTKLRLRRIARVCFVVACKVIACNIKRWAKVHTVKGPLSIPIPAVISYYCGYPA
ncbi:MAG: transposase [Syntrophorhabdaceae bacterium]